MVTKRAWKISERPAKNVATCTASNSEYRVVHEDEPTLVVFHVKDELITRPDNPKECVEASAFLGGADKVFDVGAAAHPSDGVPAALGIGVPRTRCQLNEPSDRAKRYRASHSSLVFTDRAHTSPTLARLGCVTSTLE